MPEVSRCLDGRELTGNLDGQQSRHLGEAGGYCSFAYSGLPDQDVGFGGFQRDYARAADVRSPDRFAGASTFRVTPMRMNTTTPTSSLRGIKSTNACTAMSVAWAKLDHTAKAIRLRCSDGLRTASSRKMPSVAYRVIIIANAGS